MSDNGRGAISDRHPLAMNALAGRAVFEHADVVLVVGSRFVDVLTPTASWPSGRIRFIHINIDADDLAPPRSPEVAIAADAAVALAELTEQVTQRTVLSNADAERVKDWAQAQIDQIEPQASYVRALRAAMPEDAIFVNELTQIGYLARIAFPVYAPRTYIGPGYQGTLGYGFPVALGAAVGAKGRRVISVTGDGGFGWNLQELATAQRYQLPVTLIVFNDGHYGNVRAIQKREFGAEVAVELANPDFGLLAKAFGVAFESVDSPEALGAVVKQANTHQGPVMIEVKIGVVPSPWHLLRLQPMKGMTGPAAPANPLGEAR
jgi:acetolactate synthase-1/2/3 large subunit